MGQNHSPVGTSQGSDQGSSAESLVEWWLQTLDVETAGAALAEVLT